MDLCFNFYDITEIINCPLEWDVEDVKEQVQEIFEIQYFDLMTEGEPFTCVKEMNPGQSITIYQSALNRLKSKGLTPEKAIFSGNVDHVVLALDAGVDVNIQNEFKLTPLFDASERGILDVVKILMENKAEPNIHNYSGHTAIMEAVYNKHYNIFDYLMDKYVCRSSSPTDNSKLFIMICEYGTLDMLKRICNLDIDMDMPDRAIDEGFLKCKFDMYEYLLDLGANINVRDEFGGTSLIHMMWYGADLNKAKFLLDNGVEINARNNEGETALHRSCAIGLNEITRLLLSHGARIDVQEDNGNTPLNYAASNGDLELVHILLEAGANINLLTTEGYTPLFYAEDQDVIDALKNAGAEHISMLY